MGLTRRALFGPALAAALAACAPAPSPGSAGPATPGPASAPDPDRAAADPFPVRTDATVYRFAAGEFGPELRIGSTFSAPPDTGVQLANCNGAFAWRLQQRVGEAWLDAWVPAMDACLSAPLAIAAGRTHAAIHRVRPRAGAALRPGSGDLTLEDGTYRLVWDGVTTSTGEALPEHLRVSAPFGISSNGG